MVRDDNDIWEKLGEDDSMVQDQMIEFAEEFLKIFYAWLDQVEKQGDLLQYIEYYEHIKYVHPQMAVFVLRTTFMHVFSLIFQNADKRFEYESKFKKIQSTRKCQIYSDLIC